MSDSLRPHEPQHTRPPCPSPTPGVYPNPRPLSQWCHPTISSSIVLFSSCPQSFPASGSFQMGQLFASGGQNIGALASTSVKLGLLKCSLYSVKWTMTMCSFLWILTNGPSCEPSWDTEWAIPLYNNSFVRLWSQASSQQPVMWVLSPRFCPVQGRV